MLSQKYQPISLNNFEKERQETIIQLKHLVEIKFMNVLLIGKSGSGKTAFTEAIVHDCLPSQSIDNIMRINNLKEQGIQFYRNELKHFCQNLSSTSKFVVIDDIDQLNDQCQQVIRNCIQKYSKTIHFVCSCSTQQKVNETIRALLIPIVIENVTYTMMENIFNHIVEGEKLLIEDEAKEYILKTSRNIKTLMNNLEKCKLYNYNSESKLNIGTINDLLFDINVSTFDQFTECVKLQNIEVSAQLLLSLYDKGYSVIDILTNYYNYCKGSSLYSDADKFKITKIVTKSTASFHNIHEDKLELSLFVNDLIKIL
jgi:DNA polymerase III delta prime subunit